MTMSDRIAVMRHGRIEQLGAPEELYERPTTEFVAGFLGVSNLLDAEVAGRDGRLAELRLPMARSLRAPPPLLNGATQVGSASGPRSFGRCRSPTAEADPASTRRTRSRGRARRVVRRRQHPVPRRDHGRATA